MLDYDYLLKKLPENIVPAYDGLKLNSTFITNILKCVPPGDKPLKNELNNWIRKNP